MSEEPLQMTLFSKAILEKTDALSKKAKELDELCKFLDLVALKRSQGAIRKLNFSMIYGVVKTGSIERTQTFPLSGQEMHKVMEFALELIRKRTEDIHAELTKIGGEL